MRPLNALLLAVLLPASAHSAPAQDPIDRSDSSFSIRHSILYKGDSVPRDHRFYKGTYQLLMVDKTNPDHQLKCSATLIRPRILLTAAHCVENKNLLVYAKELEPASKRKGKLIQAIDRKVHEKYEVKTAANGSVEDALNDIALVQLEREPNGAALVHLPRADLELSNRMKLIMAGYGLDGRERSPEEALGAALKDPELGPMLRKLRDDSSLPMEAKMKSFFEIVDLQSQAPLQQTPAQGALDMTWNGGKGAMITIAKKHVCSGDSGGPTYIETPEGLVVVGVHSLSADAECQGPNIDSLWKFLFPPKVPGFDTYVPLYLDWIKDNVANLEDKTEA